MVELGQGGDEFLKVGVVMGVTHDTVAITAER